MKHLKSYLAAACLLASVAASAQTAEGLRAAYFMDGYLYGHELNPSFAPEYDYASMPILANLGVGLNGNVGLNTFLYPMSNGKLATFMHPDVNAQQFLGKLHSVNHINESLNLTIYSQGFHALGGYNTIELGIRQSANISAPKDLFTFMKLGMTGDITQYNFKNVGVDASAIFELALGHSRQVLPELRVGAKVKIMLGGLNANMRIDNMNVTLSDQQWKLQGSGHVNVSGGIQVLSMQQAYDKGLRDEAPTAAEKDQLDWNNVKFDKFGLCGFGLGFDLGATYQLLPELTLSAALRDLSFMAWSNTKKGRMSGKTWTFDGFQNIYLGQSDEDNPNPASLDQQVDDLVDDLKDCFNFDMVSGTSRTSGLGATLSIGAEYTFPFYSPLHFDFLFNQRINGPYSWTEGRLAATVRPVKWFEASVSYAASSFGSSFGWVIMFPVKGFNFFVGSDHQFFKVNPQMIPVGNANASVQLGINFTFGKKHDNGLTARIPKYTLGVAPLL